MDSTDGALVQRVLAGEVEAYRHLVARYRDRLGRYAVHMLGDSSDAEEAVQDSFMRGYRSLARCDDPDRFGAWLFQILVNRCRTAGGRRMRRERTIVSNETAVLEASVKHPAEQMAWREEIDRALTRLDKDQREAFLLKYVEDMSYEDIAKVTGAGVSALKMRVKRACDRLRGMLEEVERV
jgi:RNA polymerase sigma-70 factor, ECF subfamily